MAMVDNRPPSEGGGGGKVWGLFKLPFRNTGNSTTHTTTSSSTYQTEGSNTQNSNNHQGLSASNSVSSVARSLLPTRRRLRLDPSNKLYFPCMNSRLYFLHLLWLLLIFSITVYESDLFDYKFRWDLGNCWD